jgi:hypothetical protein
MQYGKIRESFEFVMLRKLPEGYVSTYNLLKKKSDRKYLLEQIFEKHRICCTGKGRMPIVLAKINTKRGRRFRAEDIDNISFRNLALSISDVFLLLVQSEND